VTFPIGWCGCLPSLSGKYEKWLSRFATVSMARAASRGRHIKRGWDLDTMDEMHR